MSVMNRRERTEKQQAQIQKLGYRVLFPLLLAFTGAEDHFRVMQTEGKNRGGLGTRLECDNGATVQ